MTVLVAYATHSGATRTLAETLAAALRAERLEVDLVDIEDSPAPAGYDAVVLGSGVRVEAVEKTAASWARTHEAALARRPFAFFSCSGSASDPKKGGKQKATDAFLASLSLDPVAVQELPRLGAHGRRIPLHERVLLTSMRTPTGDFRDLPAVEAWGRGDRSAAEELRLAQPAEPRRRSTCGRGTARGTPLAGPALSLLSSGSALGGSPGHHRRRGTRAGARQ